VTSVETSIERRRGREVNRRGAEAMRCGKLCTKMCEEMCEEMWSLFTSPLMRRKKMCKQMCKQMRDWRRLSAPDGARLVAVADVFRPAVSEAVRYTGKDADFVALADVSLALSRGQKTRLDRWPEAANRLLEEMGGVPDMSIAPLRLNGFRDLAFT
jgi:hypothetical protein